MYQFLNKLPIKYTNDCIEIAVYELLLEKLVRINIICPIYASPHQSNFQFYFFIDYYNIKNQFVCFSLFVKLVYKEYTQKSAKYFPKQLILCHLLTTC